MEAQKPNGEVEAPAFNLEDIKKKIPKAFRGYVEPIVQWGQMQEARVARLEKGMETLGVQLQPLVEAIKQRQAAMEQMRNNPQLQQAGMNPGALGQLAQFAPLLAPLLGAGGSDPEYKAMALESMKENISLARAMKNAIVAQWSSQAAKGLLPTK